MNTAPNTSKRLADNRFGQNSMARLARLMRKRPLVREGVSLNFNACLSFIVIGGAANAIAPSFTRQFQELGPTSLLQPDFGVSKLVLACVILGVLRVFCAGGRPMATVDVLALLAGALGALSPNGTVAWAGIAVSATLLISLGRVQGSARNGVWIILLASLHRPLVITVGDLFGGEILQIDREIAAFILSLFGATPIQAGSTLTAPDGVPLLLVWECGVLSNLSLALLVWFTAVRLTVGEMRGNWLFQPVVIVLAVIVLNGVRLGAMSYHRYFFEILHQGAGATALRIAMLCVALGVAWIGMRRHAA